MTESNTDKAPGLGEERRCPYCKKPGAKNQWAHADCIPLEDIERALKEAEEEWK